MVKYIWKIKHILLIEILFHTLFTIVVAFIPYLSKLLFDYDFSKGMGGILKLALVYFGCIVTHALFQYISQRHSWKREKHFLLHLRNDFFTSLFQYDYQKFSKTSNPEYISIVQNDMDALATGYLEGFVDIFKSGIMLVVYGVYLFVFIDYRLASVIFISSILAIFLPKITGNELSARRTAQC